MTEHDQIDDQADDDAGSVSLTAQRVHVTLNDGTTFVAQCANRDYLAWDMTAPGKKWNAGTQGFLFLNFLAWSAARRDGQFAGPFDRTEDSWWQLVANVDPVKAPPVRPTPPAAAFD